MRHLELQTAPTKLDVETVEDYFRAYGLKAINFGNFLSLVYFYDIYFEYAQKDMFIDKAEFSKLLNDDNFPRRLRVAISDITVNIPMDYLQKAYQYKYFKTGPGNPVVGDTVNLMEQEHDLFSARNLSFIETEKGNKDSIIFDVLDIDGDGLLNFPEF